MWWQVLIEQPLIEFPSVKHAIIKNGVVQSAVVERWVMVMLEGNFNISFYFYLFVSFCIM